MDSKQVNLRIFNLIKKKAELTNAEIGEMLGLKKRAFEHSSAKNRYIQIVINVVKLGLTPDDLWDECPECGEINPDDSLNDTLNCEFCGALLFKID
jgi:hypothetical protein